MAEKLLILSDLWGFEKSDWIANYTKALENNFVIQCYDYRELGELNTEHDTPEEKLHQQFITGGIERAVNNLIELEKEKVSILAFSIGGTIAWEFGVKSKKIASLFAVSSTRLRYQTHKPEGEITLYYGEDDIFRPNSQWYENMAIKYQVLATKEHTFYRESKFSKELSHHIIEKS